MADPTGQDATPSGRVLAPVGVSELEEQAYLLLINNAPFGVAAVAERLGLSQGRARAVLSRLETHGLVSRSETRPVLYRPVPPEVIVPVLALRQQEELQRMRLAAIEWSEQARRAAARSSMGPEMLEVVSGPEDIARHFGQLQLAAEHEVCAFDCPPYMVAGDPPANPAEFDVLARGVSYRAIYDPKAFTCDWVPNTLRQCMRAGEQARLYPNVPTKMIIVDRKIALIPLDAQQPGAEVLVVRAPAVVDTLQMFFDNLWRQATHLPVPRPHAADLPTVSATTDQRQTDELIMMLLTGLKDDAIARQLGVSTRTLDRRLRVFMQSLGAQNRFQAGWQAHERYGAAGPLHQDAERS